MRWIQVHHGIEDNWDIFFFPHLKNKALAELMSLAKLDEERAEYSLLPLRSRRVHPRLTSK